MDRNKHDRPKEESLLGEGGDTVPIIDVAHKRIILIGTWLSFGTITLALLAIVIWLAITFAQEKEDVPLFVYIAAGWLLFVSFVCGMLLFRVTKRFVEFAYWKHILHKSRRRRPD
jgi:hypothetical protein